MAELIRSFLDAHQDLPEAVRTAPPGLLERPNPFAPARDAFPTAGEFVAYLMTAHLGYHLGQLGAWQAAAGLGRIPRPDSLAA